MFIKTFDQINKNSISEAGGKGSSLGEMTQAGIPVPPGFVLLASAFERFLGETNLGVEIEAVLKQVNHKDINSVDKASNKIKEIILEAKMPQDLRQATLNAFKKLRAKFVAVRSSATAEDSKTASWAGELETYLNVTEKQFIKSVVNCWASLWTPRAIFYRFEKKLHKKPISVAVVIQKMVESEVSGVCFTVHPVTKDRNQMVIEAGFGLGEAIVSGQITPDTYIVHKNNFSILDRNIAYQNLAIMRGPQGNIEKKLTEKLGTRQKLKDKQIMKLAKLCKKIERYYRHPQDIEWALARGKFYITQSRPITTL